MRESLISAIPTDDEEVSAEAELEAAVASVLEDPFANTESDEPPVPYGRSWAFDYQTGRFKGPTPLAVRDEGALKEWILTCVHTAAGAHRSLPINVGMESPNDVIGLADPTEQIADWEDRIRTALLVHDRIASIGDVELEWDPAEGLIYLRRLDINTDEAEALRLHDVPIRPEV